MLQLQTRAGATAAALLCAAGAALADRVTYSLGDHPSGPEASALRFDNLFAMLGGSAGLTTFSTAPYNDTVMVVEDGLVTITGTVYGGLDDGTGFGRGAYRLLFTYSEGVGADGIVGPDSEANGGTLTALADNNGVAEGTMFVFADAGGGEGAGFQFLRDGFRLTAAQRALLNDPYIGRGWLQAPNVIGGVAQFAFMGRPVCTIPLPSAALLTAAGLTPLMIRRRR
jgi:hypothetical protein